MLVPTNVYAHVDMPSKITNNNTDGSRSEVLKGGRGLGTKGRQNHFCSGEKGGGGGLTWDEGDSIFVPRIMGEGFWPSCLSKKLRNESENL